MSANEEIQAKLGDVRSRIRKVQITRGIFVTATIVLAGLLLIMASDYLFAPLPKLFRWVLFIIWIGGVLYAAKSGFAPFFRKIGLVQVARWIEERHPEIEERMSTVLEISGRKNSDSSDLIHALGIAAHHDIEMLNPELEIKSAATRKKWARPAYILASLLVLALVVWPEQSGRLLVRAVAPFSNLGNAGAMGFKLTPGNIEVLEGDPVTISISHEGPAKSIDLWIEHVGKKAFPQSLARSDKSFIYRLNPAVESFRYYAQSGPAQSDAYKITVLPLPEMLEPRLTLEYREYTGRAKQSIPLGGGFEAVEGTVVTLTSPTNTPLESAWLELGGVRLSDAKLEASDTGGRISISWPLERENSGLAVITAKHRLGRDLELGSFNIDVLPDLNPHVLLTSPIPEEITVRFNEQVPLRYQVTEDFSVAKLEVEIDAGGDRHTTFTQDLPIVRSGDNIPKVLDGLATLSVGKIRELFPDVNEVKVCIVATDNRPHDLSEGPGVGKSRWLKLKFDQGAESLARQELREEHENAQKNIEEAIAKTREAKDELAALREEVKKEALPQEAQERFAKANEKLAQTQENVEKIASQMEDSIHASKAEEVNKAAEKIDEALAKSEAAPLQDTSEKREQTLEESKQAAEQAIKNLEAVRDKMKEDQQRVEDLARIQELAQQQQELARQSEKNLQAPMSGQQQEEWRNQQQQVENQLAEQLKQRPEALAEALAEQAKQAGQLAQEAEQLSKNQSELQKQADQQARQNGQQPNPETQASPAARSTLAESLRQALAGEQQAISDEAKSQLAGAQQEQSAIADTLPEAVSATGEALADIQQNKLTAAAESAQHASEALGEAAMKSSESGKPESSQSPAQVAQAEALSGLAKRQDQVSKALAAVAEGKVEEAFQAVQKMQAEAAGELSENLNSLPQIDPSGAMQQATESARQAAQSAESASKQGQENNQQAAAPQHAQASQQLTQAAQQLAQAAQNMAQAAEQAAQQASNPQQAPFSPSDLASATRQTAEAASSKQPAETAKAAGEAAQSLAQAVEAARAKMSDHPPGPAGKPGIAQSPGHEPSAEPPKPLPDPGVPPELAKLGISAGDWEKIKASLTSDVGSAGSEGVPAEYRGLVKDYFQSISQK